MNGLKDKNITKKSHNPAEFIRVVILVSQVGQTMDVISLPWTITEQNAAVIIWRILPFLSSLMPVQVEVTAF